MRPGSRLALYGTGLVVAFGGAFGIAGALIPDHVVESWTQSSDIKEHNQGQDEMDTHSEGQHQADGMTDHDHAPDGGAPPEGIRAAADPRYPVGTAVLLSADHMPGMDGAEATISGAFDTTTYSVSYTPTTGGEPILDHRWVVHEELEDPAEAPLVVGAEAVLQAAHMDGMKGAEATIDSATDETVYLVDLEAGGVEMTNHKWVVESELQPAR